MSGDVEGLAMFIKLREAGDVRACGWGWVVPRRSYSEDELRMCDIEPTGLIAAEPFTVQECERLALDAEGSAEALALQRVLSERVALHEAGHLLVGYLLGFVPWMYRITSVQQYISESHSPVVRFKGPVGQPAPHAEMDLERHLCVALAGVVTEYLHYGAAEGGHGDAQCARRRMEEMQLPEEVMHTKLVWSLMATSELLRRHESLQRHLAAAMEQGHPISQLLTMIETDPELDLVPLPGALGNAPAHAWDSIMVYGEDPDAD